MIPVQKKLVGVGLQLFKKSLASTDERISLISEVMGSMEIIKCYAWEPSLKARIVETRDVELKWIKQNSIVRAINMFFISAIPIFVTFFTFLVYVSIPGNKLTASVAFTSLSLFSVLRMPLIMLPQVINQAIQTSVALGRLQKMLTSDALADDNATVRWQPCSDAELCLFLYIYIYIGVWVAHSFFNISTETALSFFFLGGGLGKSIRGRECNRCLQI